ncbi:SAM-dependent methyltransferase [Streptomyces californicus]|uniref:SAM-dependent methyltransferase n=1 Tax=Streptomyces californicus TaxID=67351 RepID=UPI0037208161
MSSTDLVATGKPVRSALSDSHPHVSRLVNYLGGGTDHAPCDRDLADRLLAVAPRLRREVHAHRRHTTRVVKYLASEGYTQYLDLGCGYPYDPDQDEILHAHDAARTLHDHVNTIYVDNFAPAHSRCDTSLAEDVDVAAVLADACEVAPLLAMSPVRKRIDMNRPVAALAHGLLEWVDDHQALDLLNDLHTHLPPGSALAITHSATGTEDESSVLAEQALHAAAGLAYHPRSPGHIRALLGRWTVQSPGVVPTGLWGTGYGPYAQRFPADPADFRASYAAVALKTA